jgi:hypothetical protein
LLVKYQKGDFMDFFNTPSVRNYLSSNLFRNVRTRGLLLAAVGTLGMSAAANAATQLHFDLNAIDVNAVPALTPADAATYTGIITLSMNPSPASYLDGMDIDNVVQPVSGTLTAVAGVLNMTGGVMSTSPASTLTFTIKNSDNSLHVYTGTLDELNSDGSFITGDVDPTLLDSSNFAGVNVSQWANKPVDGALIISNFSGSAGNLDVYALPEPGISWVLATAVGSLGIRRRKFN